MITTQAPVSAPVSAKVGNYRWTICAMLFAATTLNYMDRSVLALLQPILADPVKGIGLTQMQYSGIVSAFTTAYALGVLMAGKVMDRIGARAGYAAAIGVWSISAMSHALVSSVMGFSVMRFLLGVGESGNFPAAIKVVSEWFPRRERALATGLFNSGSNIGATIAPYVIPWIALTFNWRYAFLCTGVFSVLWVIGWLAIYRRPEEHPRLGAAELAYIQSDAPASAPAPRSDASWLQLLTHRQSWAVLVGKFMTDPVWWFYLFWLPPYLTTQFHINLKAVALPMLIIYNVSAVGSIFGGWLPAHFISCGWTPNRARKTAMLCYALAVAPTISVGYVRNMWLAVAFIAVAAAAHQAWSANMFTLASDMFPSRAVGSVTGIGGFGGAIAMAVFAPFIGLLLKMTGSYLPVFLLCGSAYLLAWILIQLLAPRLEPAQLD